MRFLLPFLLLLAACNKQEPKRSPDNVPGFFVGVKPVNVVRTPFMPEKKLAELNLAVSFYDTDPPKRGELKIKDLPAGIKATFSDTTGINSFTSTLTLFDSGVANGTYNATVQVLTNADYVFAEQPLKITISGETDCAAFFVNRKYSAINNCGGANLYDVSFAPLIGSKDTVLLQNFKNNGTALRFPVSCDGKGSSVQIGTVVINGLSYGSYYNTYFEDDYPNTIKMRLSTKDANNNLEVCDYTLRLKP